MRAMQPRKVPHLVRLRQPLGATEISSVKYQTQLVENRWGVMLTSCDYEQNLFFHLNNVNNH